MLLSSVNRFHFHLYFAFAFLNELGVGVNRWRYGMCVGGIVCKNEI